MNLYSDDFMFDRIHSNPAILSGKPCIRGTRISVEMILEWLASGASREEILHSYPHLSVDDLDQAIRYAARFLENEIVVQTEIPH